MERIKKSYKISQVTKEKKLVDLLSGVARFIYIKEIDELYCKPMQCNKCLAF